MKVTEEWLKERYVDELELVEDIAKKANCGVANIRRYLKKWKIRRGKACITNGKTLVWNRGLTKDTDERLKNISEMHSGENNPMYGVSTWNAGLTKHDDPRLAQLSLLNKGKKHSVEVLKKMSNAKKGLRGDKTNRWKGGISYRKGYGVYRSTINGKRMYLHRIIAEQSLGRALLTDEHVHHIDRDKANNEPANLLVLNCDDHNRLHRAIEGGFVSAEQQKNWLRDNNIFYEEVL